jgi:membrane protein
MSFARELAREWRDDRASGLAAEMAFFGILSLFPTLLTLVASLGSLDAIVGGDVAANAEREVITFLERVLSDNAAATIEAVQDLFTESSSGIITIGTAVAVWSGSRGFVALIRALNLAYDIDERRGYVVLRVVAVALALGTIVVMALTLAMLVVGPLLGTGHDIADKIGLGDAFATFWDWVRWPVALLVMVGWAATLFHFAPNHRTPWRWDLPGALVAAASWGLLSAAFRGYLAVASDANQVLGMLGGALIVLVWLYLLAIGLLLGGETNAILAKRLGVRQQRRV